VVVLEVLDTPTHDTVDVAVILRNPIPNGGTRPGEEYGMIYDYILQTRHTANIHDLRRLQLPPHITNPEQVAYLQYWIDCRMNPNNMRKFVADAQRPRQPPRVPGH
jgi:hypothetical protein